MYTKYPIVLKQQDVRFILTQHDTFSGSILYLKLVIDHMKRTVHEQAY